MHDKEVPFFANTEDGTHCVQASFRIILKYFLPERDFTWTELDELSKKEKGKGTWWFPFLAEIQKLGLDIIDVSRFDLKKFYKEGEVYLRAAHDSEVANWMFDKSNLMQVRQYIPLFLKTVDFQNRMTSFRVKRPSRRRLARRSWSKFKNTER